jgi:hypothetical protein
LQWIRNPDAQGNATVFLAKFYGRAGLINLITAGPENVRPAIFRSLLYEACGRMLNPVYGSVGLLWSGNWKLCQNAVENVLLGMPIAQPPPATTAVPPLKTCDIRHVSRSGGEHGSAASGDIHGVANSSRGQFKRRGAQRLARPDTTIELVFSRPASAMLVDVRQALPLSWAPAGKPSQEYSVSHDVVPETDSNSNTASVDTVEVSHVSQSEPEAPREIGGREVGLDLALGLLPTAHKMEASRFDDDQHDQRGETVKIGFGVTASRTR